MLRGLDYTAFSGKRYATTTVEVRVPFVRALVLDAPLPIMLTNIRGVLFADAGTAFDEPSSFVGADAEGGYRLQDIAMGIGFGFRANLGIFLLREDTAWATDLAGIAEKPVHYITLGACF
jgi:outer membrane protein assembly factor BamA